MTIPLNDHPLNRIGEDVVVVHQTSIAPDPEAEDHHTNGLLIDLTTAEVQT